MIVLAMLLAGCEDAQQPVAQHPNATRLADPVLASTLPGGHHELRQIRTRWPARSPPPRMPCEIARPHPAWSLPPVASRRPAT
jgi:hypothetical protein